MDRSFSTDPIGWLMNRPLVIMAVLALILLAAAITVEGFAVSSPASRPSILAVPTALPRHWTPVTGLFSGAINTLAIQDPEGISVIYAGTEGGVFKSLDRGMTWTACNGGLSNRLVRSLALDPDDPNVLYAGTWNGKVHLSTDAGESWQERSRNLPPMEIRALIVHTHNPNRLYAGTPAGVYTSTDQGLEWRPAAPFNGTLQCLAMDPDQPEILYVGTAANGIFKTVNGGASWFALSAALPDVTAIVIAPRATSTVYALSEGKVFKSVNSGLYWQYADSYRDEAVGQCLALNPRDPQQVYVGLKDGLHKSDDGRQTWFRSDTGMGNADLQTLGVDPLQPNVVYASTGNDLLVSTDSGRTWEQRSSIWANTEATILALKADPKNGRTFYASVAGGGLFKTTDAGEQWEHVSAPLPAAWITAVAINPVDTHHMYVGIWEGFVFHSKDGGVTWTAAGDVGEAQISVLAVDPERPQRIYAGTEGKGLFRSEDEGQQWQHIGDEIGTEVRRLVIDPRGPQTSVYVLTEKGLYRSQDAGTSWELYLSSVADLAPSLKGGSFKPVVVPIADPGYVTGQGLSNSIVVTQQTLGQAEVKELMVSPAAPQDIYLLANGLGVLRIGEAGTQRENLGAGLEGLELRALALGADDPNLVLVGTDRGIYRYQPTE